VSVARVLSIVLAVALAAPAAGYAARDRDRHRGADLVLHSGFVWTGDKHGSIARAVAIKGERIVAVGSDRKVLRHAGSRTRRINLRGTFVAPGFRDQHTHLLDTATTGAPASEYRPTWEGYDEQAAFESRRRTGQRHVDIHAQGRTPLDGCAHSPVTDKLKSDLLAMQEEVANQGLSTVVEAGLEDLGTLDALFALSREGKLKVRFLVRVAFGCMEEAAQMGLRTGSGDEWVRILGVKMYADGWLGPRTSALREPYSDDPYGFPRLGILFLEQARANRDVARARELGFNVTTHTIGDRGLLTMLNAYEANGVRPRDRWAVEHVQVAGDDLLARMAEDGVIASIQLSFATSDQRFAEDALGPERTTATAYRWRTMLERGVKVAGGSDFNIEALSPLWGLQRVVTRREFDGTPPGGWHPEQRLGLQTALRLITSADAYASFEERERGTVEKGKYADLVVLEENLFATPRDCIAAGTVAMTITNGRVAFSGAQAYPPGDQTCLSGTNR
jgi:predicted amidohydrolase YtcJ